MLSHPPERLVRFVTLSSSDWILTDYRAAGGVRAHARKFVALWLSTNYAARLAAEVDAAAPRDDIERIEQTIRQVQLHILTGALVPHDPQSWPVFVSGIGDCDQINGAACRILAHWFARAEIYALLDPRTKASAHTVGRVWSVSRREWLYFDAGFDRPVVYRHPAPGAVEILDPHAAIVDATRQPPPTAVYVLDGYVMNAYRPGYFGYLVSKLTHPIPPVPLDQDGPAPAPAAASSSNAAAPAPVLPPPTVMNDAVFTSIRAEYLRARIDDLCGDESQADQLYRRIAGSRAADLDYRAAELRLAAQHFVAVRAGNPASLFTGG